MVRKYRGNGIPGGLRKNHRGARASIEKQYSSQDTLTRIDGFLRDRKDGTFFFVTEVQVSPVFFSWLFQTEDNVRLHSPQSVREQYLDALKGELDRHTTENR